jgi:hypothetical protein
MKETLITLAIAASLTALGFLIGLTQIGVIQWL